MCGCSACTLLIIFIFISSLFGFVLNLSINNFASSVLDIVYRVPCKSKPFNYYYKLGVVVFINGQPNYRYFGYEDISVCSEPTNKYKVVSP